MIEKCLIKACSRFQLFFNILYFLKLILIKFSNERVPAIQIEALVNLSKWKCSFDFGEICSSSADGAGGWLIDVDEVGVHSIKLLIQYWKTNRFQIIEC